MTKGSKPVVSVPFSGSGTDTSGQTSESLQKHLESVTTGPTDGACPAQWQFYCQQISEAIDMALKRGKRVMVVTEPYVSDQHVEQQRALEGMLSKRFAGESNVRYLNLGRTVDLRDTSLCWDGTHLTAEGNRRIAAALIQPVTELLEK